MTWRRGLGAVGFVTFVAAGAQPGSTQPVEPLPALGRKIARAMRPGEVHQYQTSLRAGELLGIVVEQRGIDVVLSAFDARGRVAERDGETGRLGPEPLWILARTGGAHRIELAASENGAVPGSYELGVTTQRRAGASDRMRLEAQTAHAIAQAGWHAGSDGEARRRGLRSALRAIAIWQRLGHEQEVSDSWLLVGDLHLRLGNSREADDSYRRSLELAVARGDRRGEGRALRGLGVSLVFSGQWQPALRFLPRAVEAARASGDTQVEAGALVLSGVAWTNVGEYQKAIEALEAGARMAEIIGSLDTRAWALGNLATPYVYLGEHAKALQHALGAEAIWERVTNPSARATALGTAGWVSYRAGRQDRARDYLSDALRILRHHDDPRVEAFLLVTLAHVEREIGDLGPAGEHYAAGLRISRKLGDPQRQGFALEGLGRVSMTLGDLERARGHYEDAISLHRRRANPADEARVLAYVAQLERREGRLAEARATLERALTLIESVRAKFDSQEIRLLFTAVSRSAYDAYGDVLMRLDANEPLAGNDRLAFLAGERARARTLAERLATASLETEAARPVDVDGASRLADAATALVSYFVTADAAYVFLLRAGAFAAFRLTVSPAELEGRVRNYVDLMMRGDTDAAKRIGRRLHAELVSPWLDGLGPAVRELIFVLDGPLHYLPFETLGDRPMVEDFEISYAPSATVLAGLRKGRDASRPGPLADLFLVANTWSEAAGPATTAAWRSGALSTGQRALPFAAVEAKRIAPYAGKGSEILVGAQASEERIRATALDRFRVLHFATHGLAAGDSLAQSALLLGPGPSGATGYLRATDIYRLKLASDLVVLSACRTAHGRLLGGEGVQSLAQAFLSAGARTVVASLWNVPDESTASFMAAFYEALSRGRTKGQALREAKLEFLRSSRWSAPRHWAPFVLIGDARETIPLPRPSWWRRLVMTASR